MSFAGYAGVPAAIMLEAAGVPVPAETALVAAAVLAGRGQLNIGLLIALAAAAAITGDQIGYLLGRRFGRRVLVAAGPLQRLRRGVIERGDRFFAAHGAKAVFLGRWVSVGRIAIAWLAGADRMRWRRFALWNALGGTTWATTVALAAYYVGAASARWLALALGVATIATLAWHAGLVRAVARAVRRAPRRPVAAALALGVAGTAFAVFVLPSFGGAGAEWRRVREGNPAWLALAVVAECLSYAAYVALLRAVFAPGLRWRDSFLITMAGVAATRLLATAGAGGIALTSWALLRLGLPARRVARGMVAFLVLLYAVYMGALLAFGVGLGSGALPGPDDAVLTLVPAALGAGAIAVTLATAYSPAALERRLAALAAGAGRLRRPLRWLDGVLAGAGDGIHCALALARRRPWTLLAALGWWAFDIAALAVAYRMFGRVPEVPVLVMGYFVGMLGNVLPLPGGVGGVEGGMIAAFAALGEPPATALAAVLAYRLVSFWLPTLIGAPAYLALRRSLAPRPPA